MTNETKTYAITELELVRARHAIQYRSDSDFPEIVAMLQSLPLITGEPVAYLAPWYIEPTMHSEADDGLEMASPACEGAFPVYTSPQALTQQIGIEAADFAGWLVDKHEQEIIYEERLIGWLGKWLKHRSEAT